MATANEKRRTRTLKVTVFEEEAALIEARAAQASLSVAAYLRTVGQGYELVAGRVDLEAVREMARINGDVGRLGGLIKLWLTNDARARAVGPAILRATLQRIDGCMAQIGEVMLRAVAPRARVENLPTRQGLSAAEHGE